MSQEIIATHEIRYQHKITGRPLENTCMGWAPAKVSRVEEHTAIILETKEGKFAPLDAYGDPGNYLYMAKHFPDRVSPMPEYKTYKQAVKAMFKGHKSVKILNEARKGF